MGKVYEKNTSAEEFAPILSRILPDLVRVLRVGGSICWQIGYHVNEGVITPLDVIIYNLMAEYPSMRLRNRIVWTFGHGLHSEDRFSGRHETILWYTKGKRYYFDLDAVRILQKYPGKRHYKGTKHGKLSGNPKGKNPADVWDCDDVWDIPNVKANHVEKTVHPCQFPVSLAARLVAATTRKGALVLDPFMGVGTTGVAACLLNRRFVGAETNVIYHRIATQRIEEALGGRAQYRPDWQPIYQPPANTPLTAVPASWRIGRDRPEDVKNGASTNGARR